MFTDIVAFKYLVALIKCVLNQWFNWFMESRSCLGLSKLENKHTWRTTTIHIYSIYHVFIGFLAIVPDCYKK
jgi:hypothetical protein